MSVTITDPQLLATLAAAVEDVEVRGPDGRVIGRFVAGGRMGLPAGVTSPFTPDQLADLRRQRDGRPLADVLRDLAARP